VKIPFLKPRPVRLSTLAAELAQIEDSGIFSNFGPVNSRFEEAARNQIFGGTGACLTVTSATAGLLLAIRQAIGENPGRRPFALMPSFTFAAAAHAALWNQLTPLLYDIEEAGWIPSAEAEEALIARHGPEIAVIVPYATFGNDLDLARYHALSARHGIPVVIDAAASLGTLDRQGRGFGAGCPHPVVFSMHATKPFATAEGGLIYCADAAIIAELRAMANFGFAQPRVASLPGLNAKLGEINALLALSKLRGFDEIVDRRAAMAEHYRARLDGWSFQHLTGRRTACTFMPVLLPEAAAPRRAEILRRLAEDGIGAGTYFSPHLAEHPYFQKTCVAADLSATERIARRIVVLPMSDTITPADIDAVCDSLLRACAGEADKR
jgi:dTDP-4-amino-4,6-dideoxygalactose transaminase